MKYTTQIFKKSIFAVLSTALLTSTTAVAQNSTEKSISTENLNDLRPIKGEIRRDPSDIIKVADTYYIYYSKMVLADEIARTKKTGTHNLWPEGYNADIWVASSNDEGRTWKEVGPMILRGENGEWDMQSAFTPNIISLNGKYYLYYTGVGHGFTNRDYSDKNRTAFGLAISDSPTGPFIKIRKPVFETSADKTKFDSFRVDDTAFRLVDGKVWLYYKGRAWKKPPIDTKMGLAIAANPEGPFVRTNNGDPIQSGGHEVMVWEHGPYIFNYVSKTKGQKSNHLRRTTDGHSNDAPEAIVGKCATILAPSLYRPELTGDKVPSNPVRWGMQMKYKLGSISLERFTLDLTTYIPENKGDKQTTPQKLK